jgi:hypothetical protein
MTKTSISDIKIVEPALGQWVSGWVTSTQTPEGAMLYGPFGEKQHALDWASKLTNAIVTAVYYPTWNAG